MTRTDDEFYVGYLATAPAGIARHTRRVAFGLILALPLLGLALAQSMHPFSKAVFEYGVEREFEGVVRVDPYATLVVDRPGDRAGTSRYLLVGFGKFGAVDAVADFVDRRVTLTGSLIYRDDQTMIELLDGSIAIVDDTVAGDPTDIELEDVTLVGEIVDSKCFLGVMKPGNLKPHRACATRCISGGVPPLLLVRDAAGHARSYLLVDEQGGALNQAVLDRIAEPVSVSGRTVRRGDLHFLYAAPDAIRRVD